MNEEIPISQYTSPNVVMDIIWRMKIKDVMTKDPLTGSPDLTMRQCQQLMKENQVTGLPIVEKKRCIGIISMDDIVTAFDKGYIDEKASSHMSRQIYALEDDMPVSFAIRYFDRYHYHRYPVLNKAQELVGIITSRDISRSLLLEMNKEVEALEQKSSLPVGHISEGKEVYTYPIIKDDFENAGYASTQIKKRLKSLGVSPKVIRRAAIAAYELEMNVVIHSDGGTLVATYTPGALTITVKDTGPGIPDTGKALTPGWSTASEWIRSLGFGAGMGLPNARNCSDDFTITSSPKGTTVVSVIKFNGKEEVK